MSGIPSTPSTPTSPSIAAKKRKAQLSSSTILLLIFTNGLSFFAGNFYATQVYTTNESLGAVPKQRQLPNQLDRSMCPPPTKCPKAKKCPVCPEEKECPEPEESNCPVCTEPQEKECPKAKECPKEECEVCEECEECPPEKECPTLRQAPSSKTKQAPAQSTNSNNPFPELVSRFAAGMAYATHDNFTKTYDLGVPLDIPQKEGDKGVLIIYNTPKSKPFRAQREDISGAPLSALEATQNCDQMNVVFSYHEGRRKQCLAIVPQYESFHMQKWMRVPPEGPSRRHDPLRMVPRGYNLDGTAAFHPPKHEKHTKKHWKMLETYLDSIDSIVEDLTPIVKKIAVNNAIVVMVANFGQSQLLINFACQAKGKGLDTSMVLVFATDQETKDLAESVGLKVYFDERNFGKMPKKAAQTYGDGAFTNMMLSKVICVHMASLLDVDLLFQDADVIWFKNPLTEYFQKKIVGTPLEKFDAYFQDDGSRSLRFAPYCANSGFYFFRSNSRTKYFMTSFLMQSDLVLRSFSHQSAMISILAEHSSLLGLTVKVLDPFEFPSGHIYHRKRGRGNYGDFFKDFYQGKIDPYIFHMSWTKNKENKILFYRQMDQWYLQDKCIDTKVHDIPGLALGDGKFVEECCSAESLFSCHWRDKPSSRECPHAPTLVRGADSYWAQGFPKVK